MPTPNCTKLERVIAFKNTHQTPHTGRITEGEHESFFYLILVSILGISACTQNTQLSSTQQTSSEPDSESIGWTDGACLAIKNASLQPNQSIWWLETNQANPARRIKLVAPSSDPAVCPALLPDRAEINRSTGYYFYALAGAKEFGLGIAFIEQPASEQYESTSCLSSEGLVFNAKPKNGAVLQAWSGYYYLGYDTESTCAE